MESPLASLLINNYNYASFLRAAVDSALNQNWSRCEVIVVDDGSTDDSRAVLESYGTRIQAIFKPNGGQASAINAGFAASRGQYVFLLDGDDLSHPDRVRRVVETLEANPDCGWGFHALERWEDDTGRRLEVFPRESGGRKDLVASVRKGKMPIVHPSTSGLCFRRDFLAQILPMPVAQDVVLSDAYIKFASAGLAPGWFFDEPLGTLRLHGTNRYSGVRDVFPLKTRIALATTRAMRDRWPEMGIFCDGWMGDTMADALWERRFSPEAWTALKDYLSTGSKPVRILDKTLRGLVRRLRKGGS